MITEENFNNLRNEFGKLLILSNYSRKLKEKLIELYEKEYTNIIDLEIVRTEYEQWIDNI